MRIVSYIFYIIHGIIVNDPALLWMTSVGSIQLIIIWMQIKYYHKSSHDVSSNVLSNVEITI